MRFFLLANSFFIVFSNNMNIISKYNTNLTFKSKINPIKPYKLQTRIGEISISEVNFDKELTCKFIRRLNKFFCKNFAQDTKDTNYSIYILPEQSPVNTICQLYLIPANKSVVNKTETEIDINEEGKFKITLIARVIDNEAPFEIMYNMVIATYEKDKMIGLIVGICFGAVIIIALIWIFISLNADINSQQTYLINRLLINAIYNQKLA